MTEDIHRRGIERELPCKLSNSQLLEIAISKANLEAHLEELEAKFEDVKREWTTQMKDVEKRISTMSGELRTREQRRVIECYERWRDGATLEIVRTDTGEVIDVRVATLRDKQPNLPATDDEPAAAADVQTGFPEDDDEDDDDGDAADGPSDELADKRKRRKGRKG